MKKIYTLLAAALLLAGAATAQKKVNLKFQIVSPANGSTIQAGVVLNQKLIVTNLGPGAIVATDTVFMHDPFSQQGFIWLYTGYSKAVGDTIQLNKTYTPSTTNGNGTRTYCVYGYARSGTATKTDSTSTTPGQVCNSVTFAGGLGIAGTATLTEASNTEAITIFPNPAYGTISMSYVAKNSSELTARVVDITGRAVRSISFGKVYAGQTGFKMDISNLNTGIYFVELRQDGIRAIGKVTKQ